MYLLRILVFSYICRIYAVKRSFAQPKYELSPNEAYKNDCILYLSCMISDRVIRSAYPYIY